MVRSPNRLESKLPGTANTAAAIGPGAISSPAVTMSTLHTRVRNSTLASSIAPNAAKKSVPETLAAPNARALNNASSRTGAGCRDDQ